MHASCDCRDGAVWSDATNPIVPRVGDEENAIAYGDARRLLKPFSESRDHAAGRDAPDGVVSAVRDIKHLRCSVVRQRGGLFELPRRSIDEAGLTVSRKHGHRAVV